MIFTYENGEKQFFTRKQYRRYNALRANVFAQLKRGRAFQKALVAWFDEHHAAFARGKRFVRRAS